MLEHHRQAVDAFVQAVADDGTFQAVIVVGSLVTGRARASSDVDADVVVSDEEFAARRVRRRPRVLRVQRLPRRGRYGNMVSVGVLEAAAERGKSSPCGLSLIGVEAVVYSGVEDLHRLVDRIRVYPEMIGALNTVLLLRGVRLARLVLRPAGVGATRTCCWSFWPCSRRALRGEAGPGVQPCPLSVREAVARSRRVARGEAGRVGRPVATASTVPDDRGAGRLLEARVGVRRLGTASGRGVDAVSRARRI